jgi:hypothetical protein
LKGVIALKIMSDSVFFECGTEDTPINRYICHIDEKIFMTYSSKGRADNAFKNNGFFLSDYTTRYKGQLSRTHKFWLSVLERYKEFIPIKRV